MESVTTSQQYNPWTENEISVNANGGTELMKRRIAARVDPELASNFQVICSRVRDLHDDKIRILWVHDLPADVAKELSDNNLRSRFHKIVFCGNWQYQQFIDHVRVPIDHRVMVIDNGIVPIPDHKKPEDEINLIYFSTPQRGLDVLLDVFLHPENGIAKMFPNVKLHVCSSFKIYGMEHLDAQDGFKRMFDACKEHPQIVYHGTKTNDEMRELLQKMHVFAYPSTWPECNSLASIEAMSARLLCVVPNYAGLMDTFGGMSPPLYQWQQDRQIHAAVFHANLVNVINNVHTDGARNLTGFMKNYADSRFNIDRLSAIWTGLMTNLAKTFPDIEKRKIPNRKFQYNPFE